MGQTGQVGQIQNGLTLRIVVGGAARLIADFVRLKSVDFGSSRARLLDSEAFA